MTTSKDRAMELRLQGETYAAIGTALGVSRQRIIQMLNPPPAIRKIVVDRAGGLCEKCGILVGESGAVHHKASRGLSCDQYHDLDNLALVCPSCHRMAHHTPAPPKPVELKSEYAAALGRKGGQAKSAAKTKAAKQNILKRWAKKKGTK